MKPGTYPQIRRSPEGLADLVSDRPNWVGNDLEFTAREEPTHCSLSVDRGDKAWALTWDACKSVLLDLIKSKVQFVGHAWLTADRPIIQRELGLEIPLEQSHDTMIMHYLCNAELTALPKTGRQAEDDPEVRRGAGHMDLWTMASIYTLLPQWKKCRGRYCQGPCPEHDFEGYNGVDAVAPDIAYPALQEDMKRKGIPDSLYLHMKRLALVCNKMKRRGIRVDRQYITELGERLDAEKDRLFKKIQVREACAVCARLKKNPPPCKTCVKLGLVNDAGHGYRLRDSWDAPFNPNSPQAVVSWFDARGVGLRGTTKDEIFKQLQKVNRNPEQYDDDAVKWLRLLHDYKEGGKGLKAWFDERYINAIGLAHPRFIECGTSTGRLASSNPNFQNLPKHGFGREVRRAIVPRSPERLLLKADYKQLELRMVLWCSGVTEDFTDDAFTWLVQANPGLFESVAQETSNAYFKKPRNGAKRTSHASNYLEGFKIVHPEQLNLSSTLSAVSAGALEIHEDWEYGGGLVAFTGSNLAVDLFGSASYTNRKRALELQRAYFKRFPEIRPWHRKVTQAAETGEVRSASGRYLRLRGLAFDKAKEAAAFFGQGQSADYVQEAMLRYDDNGVLPLIQVHDELVFEADRGLSLESHRELIMDVMPRESSMFPGFSCPVSIEIGENYLDCEAL